MASFSEKQLEISNKSYTNKDFEAIYVELLETAEKISKRFSPTSANEADPFIVLLKLVAAVSDKINYNVDKNVLERFLLSCTQEKSMRELTDMLGYSMKYYRSAETSVIFKYDFSGTDEDLQVVEVPAFSIITDGDSIQYITVENTKIARDSGVSNAVSAIQGKLKTLEILGSTNIQLENLNANNRLYLPEVMIAENGISIASSSSPNSWQAWSASNNLNLETYGSNVYKFGFDSVKNLPYLDFPTWVADIIGKGLTIKYLITDGSAGNVAARALTTVSRLNPPSDNIKDQDIKVINLSAATSGREPETMSEAYAGFKKTIGTFDTLITCRDYANKIYELLNIYGNPYVSNIQVSDRRTDINYGCDVMTASTLGTEIRSKISSYFDVMLSSAEFEERKTALSADSDINKIFYIYDTNEYLQCKQLDGNLVLIPLSDADLKPQINPYDLCLYGLRPISNTSYLAVDDANGYNKSYNMITNASDLKNIQMQLEQYKTMSHNYKELLASDIGYIQNLYKLDATINTSRKVNILEQNEILININNALISKYNPRSLKFGQEIAFDELLATIEGADLRIKSVSLQEPEQTPKIILRNNAVVDLYNKDGSATDQFKFIISKNLLSGRVEAFEYDTEFNYSFYHKNARKYTNIVKASTACNLEAFPAGSEEIPYISSYKLNENEAIQFLAPNLVTEVTYPYGINYYLEFANPEISVIPKNSEYKLQPGDSIIFTYINNNDETVIVPYTMEINSDDVHILKPNFDLYSTKYRIENRETPTKTGVQNDAYKFTSEKYKFYTLAANQSVEYRTLDFDKLRTFKKCYWLTNQTYNEIRWEKSAEALNTYTYILADDEYFFYTDSNLMSLYAFGAGTRLRIKAENEEDMLPEEWQHNNYVNIDDITLNGLSSLGDYFIGKSFDETAFKLDIFENELITITSDDIIQITNYGEEFEIPDNNFAIIPTTLEIKYKYNGVDEEFNSLPDRSTLNAVDAGWQIRAVLDLNSGPNTPQRLVGNQTITFTAGSFDDISKKYFAYDDINKNAVGCKVTLYGSSKHIFESTVSLTRSGGENINLQYMDLDLTYKCPSILRFINEVDPVLQNLSNGLYAAAFSSNPQIEGEDDDLKAVCACRLHVPPVDLEVIEADEPNWIDSTYPLTADTAYKYLNNHIYYDNNKKKYYKCKRVCTLNTNEIVVEEHDSLDTRNRYHKYEWEEVTKVEPSARMFMIHVDGINNDRELKILSDLPLIRSYNTVADINHDVVYLNELALHNGLNIIEVKDSIDEADIALCESLLLKVSAKISDVNEAEEALSDVSCYLSQFKVAKNLNPLLGIDESDDIFKFLKKNFNEQFKEFFICADLDPAKHIELSEDYKLNSAQAFYDTNNVANMWTLCKIDFPSSNIKIARGSKK